MNRRSINWLRLAILFCAIGFIVAGVMRDEHMVVLHKAINVCLECIGIG